MILIVDDIPENVYSLKKVLEHYGFEVDTAFSGEEALKKMLSRTYVLVLLDVQMPGIDGFEVAENIKGFKKAKDTAIIFLSANSTDTALILKGYSRGAIDYITKPVDIDLLVVKVKTLYLVYQARQEANRQQLEVQALYAKVKEHCKDLESRLENLEKALETARLAKWEYLPKTQELNYSSNIYSLFNIDPSKAAIDPKFIFSTFNCDEVELLNNLQGRDVLEFEHKFVSGDEEKFFKEFIRVEYDKRGLPHRINGLAQEIKRDN